MKPSARPLPRAGLLLAIVVALAASLVLPAASASASSVSSAARVTSARVVDEVAPTADTAYVARVAVRAVRRSTVAQVQVRHVVGSTVVRRTLKSLPAKRGSWRSAEVPIRTRVDGGELQVLVTSAGGRSRPVRVRTSLRPRVSAVVSAPRPTSPPAPRPSAVPLPAAPTPSALPVPTSVPTSVPTTTPTTTPTDELRGWRTDMVEDFDRIAPQRWSIANGWGAANESSWLLTGNVSTVDGVLRVQGKNESAGGRSFTSGRLDTNGKYALPDYFRAEVRAKVPYQRGLWSAPLWFRPTNGQMGEIDLVETYGSETRWPTVHQTIHSAYGPDHKYVSIKSLFARIGSLAPTAWHTYTIEKTPGQIKMWVDGVNTATFTRASAPWFDEYYESGKRWNLRVNMQIGGSYGLPDETTDWSGDNSVMQLDYIKTWVPAS